MANRQGQLLPKCWAPRLWWVGLLLGLVVAYFVLRNFQMSYWVFLAALLAFAAGGATGGRFLGAWIDRNHRTNAGLLRQERKQIKAMRKWLRRVLRKHGQSLEAGVIRRKLEGTIESLGELLEAPEQDLDNLQRSGARRSNSPKST